MRTRNLRIQRDATPAADEQSRAHDSSPAHAPSLWMAVQLFFSSLVRRHRIR
jgi:hypothetical protein